MGVGEKITNIAFIVELAKSIQHEFEMCFYDPHFKVCLERNLYLQDRKIELGCLSRPVKVYEEAEGVMVFLGLLFNF